MIESITESLEEIESVEDWVAKILTKNKQSGKATEKQIKILNANLKNMSVRGVAGSGKTLCLVAKLLEEIYGNETRGQGSLFTDGSPYKKALIITFNRSLIETVNKLIGSLGEGFQNVEVNTYYSWLREKFNAPSMIFKHAKYIIEAIKFQQNAGFKSRFLSENEEVIQFLESEFDWIESFEKIDYITYSEISRSGASQKYKPSVHSDDRRTIWNCYCKYLELSQKDRKYSTSHITKILLDKEFDEKYDIIAVDEVQDLSLINLQLLLKCQSDNGKLFVVGDEDQKIYNTNFSFKELGINFTGGNSFVLEENIRNTKGIGEFASRLNKQKSNVLFSVSGDNDVLTSKKDLSEIMLDLKGYLDDQLSTVIMVDSPSNATIFSKYLTENGIKFQHLRREAIPSGSGIYLSNIHQLKGLECDRIIVPQMNFDEEYEADPEKVRRLYYVAFSRAKYELKVYYQEEPHQILTEYYVDYLLGNPKRDFEIVKGISKGLFITPESLLEYNVNAFYQITGIDNLESIFSSGLLPSAEVKKHNLSNLRIHDSEIMQKTNDAGILELDDGVFSKSIHEYVRTYFNPRNAMMYRVGKNFADICIVEIDLNAVSDCDSVIRFTDRNAASHSASFFTTKDQLDELDWDSIHSTRRWSSGGIEDRELKQKMQAEFQIRPNISPKYIKKIIVRDEEAVLKVRSLNIPKGSLIEVNPFLFFDTTNEQNRGTF